MTKLFGFLGAASTVALCGLAACSVTSSNDVSGLDGGPKSNASTSDSATDAPPTTTDGGGTDGGGTDGGSCKVTGGRAVRRTTSCAACLTDKCCAVTVGCENDADCSALMACAHACASANADSGAADAGGAEQDCINDCGTAHPSSLAKFNDADACAKRECDAQCHAHAPFPGPTPQRLR